MNARDLPDGFHDHFSSRAGPYARFRPSYPDELASGLAALSPRSRLAWDAGAGSGQLSTVLAGRFERVIATDASAEQLAHAVSHPRVEFRRARAEASGLDAGTVDLAVSAQAAHWFDLDRYYAEVRRVASSPDAVVALVSYGIGDLDGAPGEVLLHFHGVVLADHWPPERRHVEEGYRSLPFPFPEFGRELDDELGPMPKALRGSWTLEELVGYVGTWSALRSLTRERGDAPFAAFRRDLARAWGDPAARREVRWPLSIRAGRIQGAPPDAIRGTLRASD
jgi:hypothetical protein